MLILVSAVALIFTVLRTWPQFIRIVVKKEHAGVSNLTWSIALANHTGWAVYGVLAPIPLFIASNLLAGFGCAATVIVMRSWRRAAVISAIAAAVAVGLFAIADPVLLTAVNITALGMFLPQMVHVFRSNPKGVSVTAWCMAALSSVSWITYGFMINKPFAVAAHFVMLPVALAITLRTILNGSTQTATEEPLAV